MITFKSVTKVFLGVLIFSSTAYAENVISEKKAESEAWFPNAYSNVLFRNYQTKNVGKNLKGLWQVRYTLGSTFFDELLTAQVVFGANLTSKSSVIKDRGTRIEAFMTPYENDYYKVEPFAEIRFPETGKSNISTHLGLYQEAGYKFKTNAGDISLGAEYYFKGIFGSEATSGVVENGASLSDKKISALSLVKKKENVMGKQVSPNFEHELSVGVKWDTPAKGFSLGLNRYMNQEGSPVLVYDAAADMVKEDRGSLGVSKYKLAMTNLNRFRMAYSFPNEVVGLTLDTYLYDSLDVVVVSSISASLF